MKQISNDNKKPFDYKNAIKYWPEKQNFKWGENVDKANLNLPTWKQILIGV